MEDLLQYKNFTAHVRFSAEDGAFYGKVLDIDELVHFEGCTVSELKKSFYEAVDDYLEKKQIQNRP